MCFLSPPTFQASVVGPWCKKITHKYFSLYNKDQSHFYEAIVPALLSPLHLKTNLIDLFSHCFSFMALPS